MRHLAPVLVVALSAVAAYAQSIAPPPTAARSPVQVEVAPPPPTRQELEESARLAGRRVAMQEERIAKFSGQIVALDQSIEGRLAQLIQQIKAVEDSPESKARVAQIKQDAIAGLKKSIEFYARERDRRLQDELRAYSALPKEQLAQDVRALNARVEKRVDQIVEIAASLQEQEGYQRYETHWDGYNVRQEETDAYRHNQRAASRTGQEKEHLIADLQKSIETLKRRNEQLTAALGYEKTDSEKAFLREQIAQNRELIERRREQIQEIFSAAGQGRALGSKAAFQLEQMLDDIAQDLRRDFKELVRLAHERDNARIKLRNLQAQLSLIEQELAEQPPAAAPAQF